MTVRVRKRKNLGEQSKSSTVLCSIGKELYPENDSKIDPYSGDGAGKKVVSKKAASKHKDCIKKSQFFDSNMILEAKWPMETRHMQIPVVPRVLEDTSVIPNGEISKNLPAPEAPIAHIAHHVGTEITSNPPTYSSIHIHQAQPTTSEQSTPPTIATGASTPEYSHEQLHDTHMIQMCQMLKSTNVLTNVTHSPQSSGMPSSQIIANQRDFDPPQATDVPPASANGSNSKQSLSNQATLEKLKPPSTIEQQKCNSFQAVRSTRHHSAVVPRHDTDIKEEAVDPRVSCASYTTDAASDTTCPSTLMQSNVIQIAQESATPAGNSNVVPLVVQSDGKMSTFSRPMLQLGNPIKIYARILDVGVFNSSEQYTKVTNNLVATRKGITSKGGNYYPFDKIFVSSVGTIDVIQQ
ncbi:hypothetical protein RFI_32840, partial [Reticulomyxa filosa]